MYDSCATCANLDKSRKKWNDSHYCYLYGCKSRGKDGYVCGWCRDDKELKLQGCSDYRPQEAQTQPPKQTPKPTPKPTQPISIQLSIFDLI